MRARSVTTLPRMNDRRYPSSVAHRPGDRFPGAPMQSPATDSRTRPSPLASAPVALPWGARVVNIIDRWQHTARVARRLGGQLEIDRWGDTWVRLTWAQAPRRWDLRIRPGHEPNRVLMEVLEQGQWVAVAGVEGTRFSVTTLEAQLTRWVRYQGRLGLLWTLRDTLVDAWYVWRHPSAPTRA